MLSSVRSGLLRMAFAAMLAPTVAHAQERARDHTISFGQFFNRSTFGEVGLSYYDIKDPKEVTDVAVLPASKRLKFRTKVHPCWAFINHYKQRAGTTPVHVGIQMLFMYENHLDADAVFVQRNDKWVSRADGKTPLGELGPTKLLNVSLSQFAHSHENGELLDGLRAAGGRLSEKWHARVPEDDSAADQSLAFWRKDPTSILPQDYKEKISKGSKIRAENRLMKFVPTDNSDPRAAPDFFFDCKDPLLQAIVMRIHLPGTVEFERIYFIEF